MNPRGHIVAKYAWWLLVVSALVVGGRTAYSVIRPAGEYSCCGADTNCNSLNDLCACPHVLDKECENCTGYLTCCKGACYSL